MMNKIFVITAVGACLMLIDFALPPLLGFYYNILSLVFTLAVMSFWPYNEWAIMWACTSMFISETVRGLPFGGFVFPFLLLVLFLAWLNGIFSLRQFLSRFGFSNSFFSKTFSITALFYIFSCMSITLGIIFKRPGFSMVDYIFLKNLGMLATVLTCSFISALFLERIEIIKYA